MNMTNQHDPLPLSQCLRAIGWLAVAAVLAAALLWGSGCTGIPKFRSDPYLHQLATEEAQKLTDRYGVASPKKIFITWNNYQSQVTLATGIIEINRKHEGNETAIRWVIRHELRHLMWHTDSEDFANGEQEKP